MLQALKEIAAPAQLGEASIDRILAFARAHLGMDLAWISRAAGTVQVIEFVDGAADGFGVGLGTALPAFPCVGRRGRAFATAPLLRPDGRLYGYVACLAQTAGPSPAARDEQFLELVAALLAPSVATLDAERERRARLGARVQAVLDAGGPAMVFQPIWALHNRRPVACEALARFPHLDRPWSPDRWFADAAEVGLGAELEAAAARAGLAALRTLPADVAVSVNVSAAHLDHPAVLGVLGDAEPDRTIVEITEHDQIRDYEAVRTACEPLRDNGCTIAVDDAGAGFAGFQHLVELRPDIIKLDRQITRNFDCDPARAAMATALVGFGRAVGATLLAEGVETAAELEAAARFGIHYAQGYHLGRPQPLKVTGGSAPTALVLPERSRRADLWM
jgi:EAL domain-containing protein (putative c-di-GMP-specific phosphodiesterase class I)